MFQEKPVRRSALVLFYTREGCFMRGNIAAGILKHMDLQKPVANSDKDYITIAIKLAQDGEYRRLICSRIRFRVMRCSMMLPGSGQWKNF